MRRSDGELADVLPWLADQAADWEAAAAAGAPSQPPLAPDTRCVDREKGGGLGAGVTGLLRWLVYRCSRHLWRHVYTRPAHVSTCGGVDTPVHSALSPSQLPLLAGIHQHPQHCGTVSPPAPRPPPHWPCRYRMFDLERGSAPSSMRALLAAAERQNIGGRCAARGLWGGGRCGRGALALMFPRVAWCRASAWA
jgi:hypothetical protein